MENNSGSFRMIGKTISGLEDVLAAELESLGAQNIKIVNRGVSFYGDKKLLYQANYCCRSTLRILMPIAVFNARNEQELYDEIYKIDWSEFLEVNGTFSVAGVTSYSNITHSKYLALKTKDAIADQFREKFDKRPNVKLDNPDLAINVRIFRDECTVSIDSSGDSLHKRGYRVATGPAPISEVLAAGMVLLSGWDGSTPFIDPMCGSGTIPIEAALIACKIPPGSFREEYSFKHWNNFDEALWQEVKSEADGQINMNIQGSVTGTDRSGRVLQTAKENIKSAGVEQVVNLGVDFMNEVKPPEGDGVMITNPPYGERIKASDIESLYAEIGDALKKNFSGYSAWIISSHQEAMKHVGLRASQNLTVFNGPLECRLSNYEMYEGSKKEKFQKIYDREYQPQKREFRKDNTPGTYKRGDKPKRFDKEARGSNGVKQRDKRSFDRDDKRSEVFNRSDKRKPFDREERRTGDFKQTEKRRGFKREEGSETFNRSDKRKPFGREEKRTGDFKQTEKRRGFKREEGSEAFNRSDKRKPFDREEKRKGDFKQTEKRRSFKREESSESFDHRTKRNDFDKKEKRKDYKSGSFDKKKDGNKGFQKRGDKPGRKQRDDSGKSRNRKT